MDTQRSSISTSTSRSGRPLGPFTLHTSQPAGVMRHTAVRQVFYYATCISEPEDRCVLLAFCTTGHSLWPPWQLCVRNTKATHACNSSNVLWHRSSTKPTRPPAYKACNTHLLRPMKMPKSCARPPASTNRSQAAWQRVVAKSSNLMAPWRLGRLAFSSRYISSTPSTWSSRGVAGTSEYVQLLLLA